MSAGPNDAVFDLGKLKQLMKDLMPKVVGGSFGIGGVGGAPGYFDYRMRPLPLNIKRRKRAQRERPFCYRDEKGVVTDIPITKEIMWAATQHCRATGGDTWRYMIKPDLVGDDHCLVEPLSITVRVVWRKGKGLKAPAFLHLDQVSRERLEKLINE